MRRRTKGESAKVLLDSIDLRILKALKNKEVGIMKLKDELNLEHNTLRKHLDRLDKIGVLKKQNVSKSRLVLLSLKNERGCAELQTAGEFIMNMLKKKD